VLSYWRDLTGCEYGPVDITWLIDTSGWVKKGSKEQDLKKLLKEFAGDFIVSKDKMQVKRFMVSHYYIVASFAQDSF